MNLAPIVLFVYNRPSHTKQTLIALSRNKQSEHSILYIYADGIKANASDEDILKIEATRKVLREQQWCKEVYIIESDKNKGLADSIKTGVTEIVNQYGKIIVLEDDIVVGKYFLNYMNDALELYKEQKKVMHISSYLPTKGRSIKLPDTFFLHYMSCWGWATWSDRWEMFIDDIDYLYHTLKDKDMNYGLPGVNMFDQIERNYNGTLKTWAIKWYATIYLNKGLCLYPKKTLVNNIGFDGSGTNSGKHFNTYSTHLYNHKIHVCQIDKTEESSKGKKYLIEAYKRINMIQNNRFAILNRFRIAFPTLVNYIYIAYKVIKR